MDNKQSAILIYNKLAAAIAERAPLETVSMLYSCYVLANYSWNKSRAALRLGIARRTLHRWDCKRALEEV